MGMKDKIRNVFIKWLGISPAADKNIRIWETFSHDDYVLLNRVWYRADPDELSQFYKALGTIGGNNSRFWYLAPKLGETIRKIHTGIPSLMVNMLTDITIDDDFTLNLDEELHTEEQIKLFDLIKEDNKLYDIIKSDAVKNTLVDGDGAFKLSIDPDISEYPIIEYYSGSNVDYTKRRGRLFEIVFKTQYTSDKNKEFTLKEIYGKGYIKYKLYNEKGTEVPLNTLEDTAELTDVTYIGDYIMGVPLQFFESSKYMNRGQSILDGKYDVFDATDEVVSQWLDAVRLGRANKFVPEDLVPRDKHGNKIPFNPMSNQFEVMQQPMDEDKVIQPTHVQPEIAAEKMLQSYIQFLDMCIMGIMSPSTLGIDVKKLDNGEAQREKEKATLYTRNKLINALSNALPLLVDITMKTYDQMYSRAPQDYEATINFGEYANPSFEAVVETIGKAVSYGVMSIDEAVNQIYGDNLSEEEKATEVQRIKESNSYTQDNGEFGGMDNFFEQTW